MKYDVMHFEALGAESTHLEEETNKLIEAGKLDKDIKYVITPLTVQEYLEENKDIELPDIISTKTHSRLPEDYINSGNKKSVITRSAGYDHYEDLADKVNIASLREYCINAVAQTAIKFVYATCGEFNEYIRNTAVFERNKTSSFMELNENRVATVYGVGKIGKRTYDLLQANGLTTQAVDIRAEELKQLDEYKNVTFVSKEEAIKNSDILVNVMNLTKIEDSRFYNMNYFNEEYLSKAKEGIMFINVTRGEIAPEAVILDLYKSGRIRGIGLDVFSNEAILTDYLRKNDFTGCENKDILASKEIIECSIDRSENFYVQAHQGFNSDCAAVDKAHEAMMHVAYWYSNNKKGFAEQLPYYEG